MHRFLALALSIMLVVALSAQGAQAAQMNLASSAAAAAPMSGDCDDGPGDQPGMMAAMCAAYCAGMVALPCASIILDDVVTIVPLERAEPALNGRTDPPDPHPPRPAS